MKNVLKNKMIWAAIGLAVLLLAAPASAQTSILSFNSPFPFAVGAQILPAGQYRMTVDPEHMHLVVTSLNDTAFAIVGFIPDGGRRPAIKADKGLLQFTKYGPRYFLTGLWNPGANGWKKVSPSRRMVQEARVEGVTEIGAIASLR